MRWVQKRNEDLRVGDVVYLWTPEQRRRIVDVRPYSGPHDFMLAVLDLDVGVGFSVERGGYTEVLEV
jgi:hypothetical protein